MRVGAMSVTGEISILGGQVVLGIPGFATEPYAEITKVA